MFRMIVAGGLVFLPTALAQAASTPQVWQGDGFVTAITSACSPNAVAVVGDFYRLVYRPKIAAADSAEGLTFVGGRSVYLLVSQATGGSLQGSTTYKGTYVSSRASTGTATGSTSLTISPQPVATGTGTITISGTVTNFFDVTGCNVTFRAAFTPRP